MMIELDGAVGGITFRNNGWMMNVELRQPLPHDGTAGYPNSDPYRILGVIELHISTEDAHHLTSYDHEAEIPNLKFLVEIATK